MTSKDLEEIFRDYPLVLDVGANNGLSTIGMLRPDNIILAFEPNPEKYAELEKYRTKGNYYPVDCAVSDYNALDVNFNISAEDGGCSSLLEFSDNYQQNWPNRPDIQKVKELPVRVIRLDRYFEVYMPFFKGPIEYLHIDTQGSDLKVLKGLGKELVRVQMGVMEAANHPDVLYKGQNQTSESCIWLEQNGFRVNDIMSNDPKNNEVNIYFEKI